MSRGADQILFQRRPIDVQQSHETMLNKANLQKNAK